MRRYLVLVIAGILSGALGCARGVPSSVKSSEPPALRLVFCPLHYFSNYQFRADVAVLIDAIRQTRPFDEVPNQMTWTVMDPLPNEARMFIPKSGIPPLAVRMELIEALDASQPGPYKLVIIDATGSTPCAELSWIDHRSLIVLGRRRTPEAESLARSFLHELGHALGLRDECVRCRPTGAAGWPNCARSEAEATAWWGTLVGHVPEVRYVSGCAGNVSYIRPTIASLMNEPAKARDYGPVNERYLRDLFKKK